MKKKEAANVTVNTPKQDAKPSAVWSAATTISNGLPESLASLRQETISIELTHDELYSVVTAVYATYKDLDRHELKAWKGRAKKFRTLALKLDEIHDKHEFPKVYTFVANIAK
jgi:hypothetical protein